MWSAVVQAAVPEATIPAVVAAAAAAVTRVALTTAVVAAVAAVTRVALTTVVVAAVAVVTRVALTTAVVAAAAAVTRVALTTAVVVAVAAVTRVALTTAVVAAVAVVTRVAFTTAVVAPAVVAIVAVVPAASGRCPTPAFEPAAQLQAPPSMVPPREGGRSSTFRHCCRRCRIGHSHRMLVLSTLFPSPACRCPVDPWAGCDAPRCSAISPVALLS